MPQTPNHGYNVPNEGAKDWHRPLNENFRQYDTDVEVRDTDANRGNYQPKAGAKFLATDTETVYVGDGNSWNELASTGEDPDVDSLSASGNIDAGSGVTAPHVNGNGNQNLGVGTASPQAQLHVEDAIRESGAENLGRHAAVVENTSTTTGADVLGLKSHHADPGQYENFLSFIGKDQQVGTVQGSGSGGITVRGNDVLDLEVGDRGLLSLQANEEYAWDTDKYRPVNFVGIGTSNRIDTELIRARAIDSLAAEMVLDTTEPLGQNYPSYEFAVEGDVKAGTAYDYDDEEWRAWNPHGYIWIDSNGDFNAYKNKNFVQPVDTDDGEKEVVYTSTEAPTARTEASGVAELDGGRAEIDLPEHFGWVTDEEESLVVQTTPYGGSSGLKVVERSTNRLVVEDLDGEGDYEFAYTVKGTREGHADKAVVREPSAEATGGVSSTPADD